MGAEAAEQVAAALRGRLPIHPRQIIEVTMGKPLDFTPGTKFAYSNFGYCVLGRVIEAVSGRPYHEFVSREVLAPLGIRHMRLGKNLLRDRAPGEVCIPRGRQDPQRRRRAALHAMPLRSRPAQDIDDFPLVRENPSSSVALACIARFTAMRVSQS